jgi:Mn-dependent DtxR family transcriptional regulator
MAVKEELIMDIHESGEDYLEAILRLQKKNGAARSVDVARLLNVSKPSVSRAMSILMENGYVTVGETSFLLLTDKGRVKAEEIYGRHVLLTAFLRKITGVSEEQAEENACRIEHDIDDDVKKGIETWMKKNA